MILPPARARERGLTSTVSYIRGNLAPEGAIVKSTAIDRARIDPDGVYRHAGPARVFTTERAAIAALKSSGNGIGEAAPLQASDAGWARMRRSRWSWSFTSAFIG